MQGEAFLEEQFKGISTRKVVIDTLSDEEKKCLLCGTDMVPIVTKQSEAK